MRNEKDHHLSACEDDLQLIHQASSMHKPHLKTSHIPFATTETDIYTHTGVLPQDLQNFFCNNRKKREREKFSSSSSFHM
jgi:primosomal protein N'